MKKKIALAFVATSFLISCGVSKTEVKTDPVVFAMPDFSGIDAMISSLSVCKKDESTQDVSQVSAENSFQITDQIDSQDFEVKDCQGKVTRKGQGPVRNMLQTADIPRTQTISEEITFAEVTNDRTCKTVRVKIVANTEFANYDISPTGEVLELNTTRMSENGDLKILVGDHTSLIFTQHLLNVAEGKNLVTVKYFGKCLELNEKQYPNLGMDVNCKRGEEIASKVIAFDVAITRTIISGTREIVSCDKK